MKRKGLLYIVPVLVISLGLLAFKAADFRTSKSLDIFFSFFRELSIFYVDSIDPEKLIRVGMDAMLSSLDPYNELIPEENRESLEFQTTGEYGGMGSLIRRTGSFPLIAEVYEGTPAHRAGLMAGDIILSVNSSSVEGLPVDRVSNMLKGAPNTDLDLLILRQQTDTLRFQFKRDRIHIPSVPYHGILCDEGVGYIRLANFTTDSHKEVEQALKNLIRRQGATSIILDLRGNTGGLLREAVRVVNLFVEKDELVVYTKGQIEQFDHEYKTRWQPVDTSIPLVVLVDRSSASASEIVAGALQDMDRAVIIGERTFGKGLVQATRSLPYNYQLKVTTAKYYIPSGRCIQALDYSNRNEDGSVGLVTDSLISEFSTRNGRLVYDGGGIMPDSVVEPVAFNRISTMLYAHNIIFDFATHFRFLNDSVSTPQNFSLTFNDYNDFIEFVHDQNFEYRSSTENKLNELINHAKEENYYAIVGSLIDSLQAVIIDNRLKDLEFSEDQIRNLLEEEILSRYYYQRGRTEYQVRNDLLIPIASGILRDSHLYRSILGFEQY